jgi:hypothetical protein
VHCALLLFGYMLSYEYKQTLPGKLTHSNWYQVNWLTQIELNWIKSNQLDIRSLHCTMPLKLILSIPRNENEQGFNQSCHSGHKKRCEQAIYYFGDNTIWMQYKVDSDWLPDIIIFSPERTLIYIVFCAEKSSVPEERVLCVGQISSTCYSVLQKARLARIFLAHSRCAGWIGSA